MPKTSLEIGLALCDVVDHFDDLLLRGWATENGEKNLYQDGGVTAMRPPEELAGLYLLGETALPAGMPCIAAHWLPSRIRPADRFDVEIEDPNQAENFLRYNVAHRYPNQINISEHRYAHQQTA